MGFARHEHGAWCHPAADGCPADMPAGPLSATEREIVERFEAADYPIEVAFEGMRAEVRAAFEPAVKRAAEWLSRSLRGDGNP